MLTGLLLIFCLIAPALSPSARGMRALNPGGRWDLAIHLPEGVYEIPVEFIVGRAGEVTWTVLGQTGNVSVSETTGRFDGGKLNLMATTSLGKIGIDAVVEGDSLRGEWYPNGFLTRLFMGGEVRGRRVRAMTGAKSRLEVFDAVRSHVRQSFYSPDFNGVDWEGLGRHYRPLAAAARSDGELLTIIRRMLGELRSSHLEFFALPGEQSSSPRAKAGEGRAQPPDGVTWKRLRPTVGYLKIESFDEDAETLARIDRAFAELDGVAALILDLRGNGGGTLGAALRVGDHLLTGPRPVGYFASREGLSRRGLRSIDQLEPKSLQTFSRPDAADFKRQMQRAGALMLSAGGRATAPYSGRVVILIDEYCYSAAEAFAAVVKEQRLGTLIGRRTAGQMLGADLVELGGGWALNLPVWDFRTAGGARIEGRGVEPDVSVKFEENRDADLEEALKFLERSKQ
jgi:carboxyl-terminal processing protease